MDEICGYMKMKTPSRRCTHPKAKFMMEMSDKVTKTKYILYSL